MDEHVGVFNPIRKRGENCFCFLPRIERRVCPVEKVFTKKLSRRFLFSLTRRNGHLDYADHPSRAVANKP